MIFVDTGYLMAIVSSADELHARARAWAGAVSEPLVTTEYVLWETVNGFSLPSDRPRAHDAVAVVRGTKAFELVDATNELFTSGLQLHSERLDKNWSLTDCISFLVMQRRGIYRALSYDHHFEQAGFEALMWRDPP